MLILEYEMTTLNVRQILVQAAIATASCSKQQARLRDAQVGAYGLFVQAGIACKTAAELEIAAGSVFDEIRKTGRVKDEDGKLRQVNAKPNKDGTGFLIPSAMSSAKSVMVDALTFNLPLMVDGKPESFTAIRKQVQSLNAKAARETATGDEAERLRIRDALAAISDKVNALKGAELKALSDAITAAHQVALDPGHYASAQQAARNLVQAAKTSPRRPTVTVKGKPAEQAAAA